MQLWYSVFGDSLCFAVMANQSGTTNVRIAERFEAFCDALKRIEASYVRTVTSHAHQVYYPDMDPSEPCLLTHLWFVILSSVTARTPTRSGVFHALQNTQGNDGRRDIPSTIFLHLGAAWTQKKVEAKWIVCYLHDIYPDRSKSGLELFECSHRCIVANCIDPSCLTWESKANDQSRGQPCCMRICVHMSCGRRLCTCQNIHSPSCR